MFMKLRQATFLLFAITFFLRLPVQAAICRNILSSSSNTNLKILKQIDKAADELRRSGEFYSPRAWRTKTARFGLPGLDAPKELGGLNYAAKKMVPIFEHVGFLDLNMRDMVGMGHARMLLNSNHAEVLDIAKKVIQGQAYVAVAMTEKGAGSDIRNIQSNAEAVENGYLLSGEKFFNARFTTATHVVVFTKAARTGPNGSKLTAFLLPIDYPGLHFTQIQAHGLLSNSFGGVSFENVFVPEKYRIGDDGDGATIFKNHFLYWRLMQSAAAIGTAKEALNKTAAYMRERHAFGGPIGRFTHLQQELAQHTAQLHMASLLVLQAAEKFDKNEFTQATPLVEMAKAEGVVWALSAADFAMRVFGASGYSADLTDLGQRVRDLQGLRIADGTTEVLRANVVRRVYGDDFWDMTKGQRNSTTTQEENPINQLFENTISQLRNQHMNNSHVLAIQSHYTQFVKPSGGGPCPVVASANLIQLLKALTFGSSEPIDTDVAIKQIYKNLPELNEGLLTNEQVAKVLKYFGSQQNPSLHLNIHLDYQKSLQKPVDSIASVGWTDLNSDLLEVRPNEVKMMSYNVHNSKGKLMGRHFILLTGRQGLQIQVIDPNQPTKDYIYNISRVTLPEEKGSSLQLTRADVGYEVYSNFIINSIFTVSVDQE